MTIFQHEAAQAILREASEKLRAAGFEAEIAFSDTKHGEATVLVVSDTVAGAEGTQVAILEGCVVAHSQADYFAKQLEQFRDNRLANRLTALHSWLEAKGERTTELALAKDLVDRIGAGKLTPEQLADAQQLLLKMRQ